MYQKEEEYSVIFLTDFQCFDGRYFKTFQAVSLKKYEPKLPIA